MIIPEEIEVSDEIITDGSADVRTGTYMGHLVAMRTLKVADGDDFLKIREVGVNDIFSATWNVVLTILSQRFCREVVLWKSLSHPSVLKFIGVQGDMDKGQFIAVSEWTAHGNIMEYIGRNHVNRLELVHGFTIHPASFAKIFQ